MSKPKRIFEYFVTIISFVYGPLTKILTAMEVEKECYVANKGVTNFLLEMSNLFD